MIEIKGLKKDFFQGKNIQNVLKGIDLQLKNGDFITIMGKSGSGKTTLLNCISLLMEPTSGQIIFDGKDVNFKNKKEIENLRRNNIGFIFQNANLISCLTPLDNVIIAMNEEVKYSEKAEKAKYLLKKVGLEDKYNSNANSLSGGEMQRVSIVRALINSPKVLMCDEPTGALDEGNSKNILNLLLDIRKELKYTLVIVTHDKKIGELGDRRIEMKEGTISEL